MSMYRMPLRPFSGVGITRFDRIKEPTLKAIYEAYYKYTPLMFNEEPIRYIIFDNKSWFALQQDVANGPINHRYMMLQADDPKQARIFDMPVTVVTCDEPIMFIITYKGV